MSLERVDVTPVAGAPPARVERLLLDVDGRLDALVAAGLHTRLPHFAPSDYPLVWGTLAALAQGAERGERFLEWGSALGAVAGMAATLGFRAAGIEIDPALCAASRDVLATHGLRVDIGEGSFIPDDHEIPGELDDPESANLLSGEAAYDELGIELDEFRLVFAYPWPGLEPVFFDVFERHAAPGALLLSYHGLDGVHVHRNAAG